MTSPKATADRNLLLGVLALQLDFVSREQLISGMNGWMLGKDRSLGEIFVQQGSLTAERQALLEALVVEHIHQHDDEVEKSLATLSSIESVRDELRTLGDADVEASLAQVSVGHDPWATVHVPAEEETRGAGDDDSLTAVSRESRRPRFQVIRPHAQGGLGQVSVARDKELNREVALKELLDRHADNPDSRSRFLLEAEITGCLEHPGIVPVYGLGHYADGRPYYAMRFIRGNSLKDAIEQHHRAEPGAEHSPMQLRQMLGRFIDICNAIHYAHSRGVLHRDLKPGNVMLGKYGETLVVDWAWPRRCTATSRSRRPARPPCSRPRPANQPRRDRAAWSERRPI